MRNWTSGFLTPEIIIIIIIIVIYLFILTELNHISKFRIYINQLREKLSPGPEFEPGSSGVSNWRPVFARIFLLSC